MSLIRKIFSTVGILCACCWFMGQATADVKFSKEEVEQIVKDAKEHVLTVGKEQAFKDFMDPSNTKFRKSALYVFAFDFKGNCLAHIKPAMVGSNMFLIKDPNGFPVVKTLAEVAKKDPANGGWIEYLWQNPVTSRVERKYSYSLTVNDDIWLGAGIYASEKK